MKLLGYLSVFLCAAVICSGQDAETADPSTTTTSTANPTAPPQTTNTTQAPTNTTTTAPITTTTLKPDTTTGKVDTTTTTKPVTTTIIPETTTPEPETSTGHTSTVVPVTTTAAPATTAAPTPAPQNPDVRLTVGNNETVCIVAEMEVTISVKYPTKDGFEQGDIHLYNDTTKVNEEQSTNCSTGNEELMVVNFQGSSEIRFTFMKDGSKVSVTNIYLNITNLRDFFKNASENEIILNYNSSLFETTDTFSYLCNSETKVDLVYTNDTASGSSISFKKVHVQAFQMNRKSTDFLSAKECAADDTVSDIVPIAVGCALAGLVVIVLIAYLVGRRQKRQRGYESV